MFPVVLMLESLKLMHNAQAVLYTLLQINPIGGKIFPTNHLTVRPLYAQLKILQEIDVLEFL